MAGAVVDQWDPMVSFSHLYKNLLIEHCKKKGWPNPVFDVIKEGPEHVPTFTAIVMVDKFKCKGEVCGRRIEAQQSAAKEALIEIYNEDGMPLNICMLVHEAGLCKSLLFDYAQFKTSSYPSIDFRYYAGPNSRPCFICTITIGDIKYEGPCGKNKKEAEKHASLLACTSIINAMHASTIRVPTPVMHVPTDPDPVPSPAPIPVMHIPTVRVPVPRPDPTPLMNVPTVPVPGPVQVKMEK